MIKNYWTISFLFIVFIIVLVVHNFNNSYCKPLNCIILINRDGYVLQTIYEESKYVFRGIYKKSNILLRVEVRQKLSAEEAIQAVKTQKVRIEGLFTADSPAPYPGQITDRISCNKEYKPIVSEKKTDRTHITYLTGFINQQLVFGSCLEEQAINKTTIAMFYCENQKIFYQLEIIIPKKEYQANRQEYQQTINSIDCKN